MKKYVIFAGVNGAGKTTLYQTNEEYLDLPRINLDEIVRGIGSWKNSKDIRRRYDESLHNLKKVISLCDRVRIYDNTNKFKIVAVYNKGICVDRIDDIPNWCNGIV